MHVVMLGGGSGGLCVARHLERLASGRKVALVSRQNRFLVTPHLFDACSPTGPSRDAARCRSAGTPVAQIQWPRKLQNPTVAERAVARAALHCRRFTDPVRRAAVAAFDGGISKQHRGCSLRSQHSRTGVCTRAATRLSIARQTSGRA